MSKRYCPEHGMIAPMFKMDKKYGKAYPYCPYCNRLNHKTWCLFRNGYERNRQRVRVWYQQNRERKITYMRAYRKGMKSTVSAAL